MTKPTSQLRFANERGRLRLGARVGERAPEATRSRQPLSRKGLTQAFTLVEVLVVVAIIGIAGAIVVPQMIKSGTLTVQAAGRSVIADLLYAQNEAIARQSARRVVFEPSLNQYKLTDGDGNVLSATWKGAGTANYVVNFSNDSRFAGVRIENPSFGSQPYIEFDDMGSPTQGGSVDLVFSNVRYRTSVAPFTGRVTITQVTASE